VVRRPLRVAELPVPMVAVALPVAIFLQRQRPAAARLATVHPAGPAVLAAQVGRAAVALVRAPAAVTVAAAALLPAARAAMAVQAVRLQVVQADRVATMAARQVERAVRAAAAVWPAAPVVALGAPLGMQPEVAAERVAAAAVRLPVRARAEWAG